MFVDNVLSTTGYFSDNIHLETFLTCLPIAKALEHPCKTGEYIPAGRYTERRVSRRGLEVGRYR